MCLFPLCKASQSVMRWNGGTESVVAYATVDESEIWVAIGCLQRMSD